LARALAGSPGPPVLDQAAETSHRLVVVGRPVVTMADRAAPGVGLAVTAPVTITAIGTPRVVEQWAMEVLAVPFRGRWVIAEVDQ
jgi:hypothetical protein